MGFAISLVVPEEDRTEETLKEYCIFKRERRKTIKPDENWEDVEEMSDYVVGKSFLEGGRRVIVTEEVPRKALERIDSEQLYSLFKSNGGFEYHAIYGSDVESLRKLLESAEKLLRENPEIDFNPELVLRTGPLALCDFALENGYGIDLSN